MNKTKNFKVLVLISLTSALLLAANASIASVKAATTDSVYIYVTCGGTISSNGTTLTGGTAYSYANGTAVTFTATASAGYQFLCWETASAAGANTSTTNPLVYTVLATSCSVQAMFIATTNVTTSSSSGTTIIDVLTSIGGSSSPTPGTYTNYTAGKVYDFKVTPDANFKFFYWIVASSTENVYTASTLALNITLSTCAIQPMFIPTSSTVVLPAIKTINEFSTAAAVIIAAVLAISAVGTYVFTKRAKKK